MSCPCADPWAELPPPGRGAEAELGEEEDASEESQDASSEGEARTPPKSDDAPNGDACRARIEETLAFDLHPHRMSPTGLTVILFNDSTLMYRYE